MNTCPTDITVLEQILCINLNVNIWTARRKLTAQDMGGVDLPPEELASLGSKRVCDPEKLKVFTTLKARATSLLDRSGVRFLGGWAIPNSKAGVVADGLRAIRDDFLKAKDQFLGGYEEGLVEWIAAFPRWADVIRDSTVSADYVRARLGFRWQIFRVVSEQLNGPDNGLSEEVASLGGALFEEVSAMADDVWKVSFVGRTEVTQKALRPLRTIQSKLQGLSFVEPRVSPALDLLDMVFSQMPASGKIIGPAFLMLQGVVNMMRDPQTLLIHSQSVLDGRSPSELIAGLWDAPVPALATEDADLSANAVAVLGSTAEQQLAPDGQASQPAPTAVVDISGILDGPDEESQFVPVAPDSGVNLDALGLW